MNKLKLFLLFLLLHHISTIEPKLDDQENHPLEIQIGSTIEYDFQRKYFQFDYSGSSTAIFFGYKESRPYVFLTDPQGNTMELESVPREYLDNKALYGKLESNGTYFLTLECENLECLIGGYLESFIPGQVIETINFNKGIYFSKMGFGANTNYEMSTYKVSGLKEKTFVYFSMTKQLDRYYYYYPFYFDEIDPFIPYEESYYPSDPYHDPNFLKGSTIFEVCEENNCTKHVKIYQFEANHEYTIKIHYLKFHKRYEDDNYYSDYYQPLYFFFPITQNNIKKVNVNDLGILSTETPTFYIIDKNPGKNITILLSELEEDISLIYCSQTNEIIDNNNILLLSQLPFEKVKSVNIKENEENNTIIFLLSRDFESKSKLYIINDIEEENVEKFEVEANSNKYIFYYDEQEDKKRNFYISTFNSDRKSLRFLASDLDELTDVIVQNYYPFSIFAGKDSSAYTVNIKKYLLRYTLFGAVDPYLYKSAYAFGKKYLKSVLGINMENYLALSQAYFRISTKYLPFFETFNAYLNGIDVKLNLYIRRLYGWTDLYECDPDGVNLKDLSKLTKPLSNMKCKNKKSLFNRLFNLGGEKILSGYLAPDSYVDVYAEIDKDTDAIEINPMQIKYLYVDSTAKYLKKGKTYKLNFHASHLIKLEPGTNAKVTIINGRSTSIISYKYPTVELAGKNFTIRSDNDDAMVYFFGKLPIQSAGQMKIENKPGKYIKISNVEDIVLIDFGFEGYLPSTYPIDFKIREDGNIYLDNLYEKMKRPLVQDEYLYIYYLTGKENRNIKIEYLDNNLKIKNNDFNIYSIPKNDNIGQSGNTLIINAFDLRDIFYNINFCRNNTNITLLLTSNRHKEKHITNEKNETQITEDLDLFRGDNKLEFITNQPFVFSYNFYDEIDDNIFAKKEEWLAERQKLTDLTITEAKSKNNGDNKISITFKPNYQYSTTRYIIIIAQKNENNTIENFKDLCFVADLLNQRPEGVKVDYIYEASEENDTEVNAEVDISSITELGKVQNYLINIIGQELRFTEFGNQINLYTPIEFTHTGKEKSKEDQDEGDKPSGGDQEGGDDSGDSGEKDKDNGSNSTSLAFAIVTPILGVIIIILVVMVILAHKRASSSRSEEIERLT